MKKNSQKQYVFLLLALMPVQMLFQSCKAGKKVLVQGYAFYTLPASGVVMADEKGNEVPTSTDTAFFLYLDAAKKLGFDSVWFQGRVFAGAAFLFNEKVVEAGLNSERRPVIIRVDSSHYLYRLQLRPVGVEQAPDKTATTGEILLQFNYKGKNYYRNFSGFRYLETYPTR